MLLHQLLNISAIVMAYFLGWKILALQVLSITLLWAYSNQLKRLPFWGNLSVSLLTALAIIITGIFFGSYPDVLWLYTGFAFFFTLLRELVKDIEDIKGDESFGCRTIPVIWGIPGAKKVIFVIILIIALLSITTDYYLSIKPDRYFILLLLLILVALAGYVFRADTRQDFGRISQILKIIILLGVLSMSLTEVFR